VSDPYGSNPYGDQNPGEPGPGGQNNPDPYGGAPQPSPYGSPHPGPAPYGAPQYNPPGMSGYGPPPGARPPMDGVSIASFVLGLLGCTGLIALILGIVGISRTKNGQRRGRGFAIAGIVIGALDIVVAIVLGIVVVFAAHTIVTPGNAKVGQCVNIDENHDNGADNVFLTKTSCSGAHDAQIVGVGTVTSDNLSEARQVSFCNTLISAATKAKILANAQGLRLASVTENPDNMQVGDHVVCYVKGNPKLTQNLLK